MIVLQTEHSRRKTGPAYTTYNIQNDVKPVVDEIREYWNARYLSAGEATWRILGFHISHKEPAVTALPIHLSTNNYHRRYTDSNSMSMLEHYFSRPHCTFEHNGQQKHFDDLLYAEYFRLFRLQKTDHSKNGHPRYFMEVPIRTQSEPMQVVQRVEHRQHLCRLNSLRPSQGELFYFRAILQIKPARSFSHALQHEGRIFPDFQSLATALGIFANEKEAFYAMREAVTEMKTPHELRLLFIHLLINECITCPRDVWDTFQADLIFDYKVRYNGNEEIAMKVRVLC